MTLEMQSDSKADVVRLQTANLVDQVRDELLKLIITNRLEPGQRLLEADLARRFGISRGPIREAARQLQQRGLLEFESRRGFFVKSFTIEDIEAHYQFRECVQQFATRLATNRFTDEDLAELEKRYDLAVAQSGKDPYEALEAIFHFHRLIFERSGNPRFVEAFDQLVWESRQVHAVINARSEPEAPVEFFRDNAGPILEAFKHRDARAAEKAVARYLQISLADMVRIFAEVSHPCERRAANFDPPSPATS